MPKTASKASTDAKTPRKPVAVAKAAPKAAYKPKEWTQMGPVRVVKESQAEAKEIFDNEEQHRVVLFLSDQDVQVLMQGLVKMRSSYKSNGAGGVRGGQAKKYGWETAFLINQRCNVLTASLRKVATDMTKPVAKKTPTRRSSTK